MHAFAAAGGAGAVVYCRGDNPYHVPKLVYESLGFKLSHGGDTLPR